MRMTKYLLLLVMCVQCLPGNYSLHKTTVEEKLVSRENKMFNLTFPNLKTIVSNGECKKLQLWSKCLENTARRTRGVQDVKHSHQIFFSSVFRLTILHKESAGTKLFCQIITDQILHLESPPGSLHHTKRPKYFKILRAKFSVVGFPSSCNYLNQRNNPRHNF